MRLAAILIATIVAFGAVAAVPSAAVGESDSCAVLFDFGNGKVLWADIEVEEGMSAFDLTSAATEELGIDFNYSESAYGIFVNGFDGVIGAWPFEWWHLWTWNASEGIWEMSWTGAGDLSTEGLEAIAWSYVMDRPDYSAQTPLATPDHRYPWGSFRHDLSSSGNSPIDSPVRAEVAWELNLSNGQIPTSIVTARGLVYVMTSGV
ncbi:MAG: hypothetical protein FJ151_01770, partial [Euryarchaeota archaeon]|nr:hypothetical protein [Euryarchaeota archaeon]